MQQAEDFRAESEALFALLNAADTAVFDEPTQFKGWTVNMVLEHLHFWNMMAGYQLTDEDRLTRTLREIDEHEGGMRGFEAAHFAIFSGRDLLDSWRANVHQTADLFAAADPKQRLQWAGPEMSARSSITARLMETWAHGQEVYDHLGAVRINHDRIRNIVILGVNTYGWTYQVRDEALPGPMPYLKLTAPSGEVWTYGDERSDESIEGTAEAFCQIVTQVRNVTDTDLEVTGIVATDWMSKAQCFAGGAQTPPAPGLRKTRVLA